MTAVRWPSSHHAYVAVVSPRVAGRRVRCSPEGGGGVFTMRGMACSPGGVACSPGRVVFACAGRVAGCLAGRRRGGCMPGVRGRCRRGGLVCGRGRSLLAVPIGVCRSVRRGRRVASVPGAWRVRGGGCDRSRVVWLTCAVASLYLFSGMRSRTHCKQETDSLSPSVSQGVMAAWRRVRSAHS